MHVGSLGQEDPLEEERATHLDILAWRIPMDRGARWATVHGVTQSWTQLSNLASKQAHPYTDTRSFKSHTCTHVYHSHMHTLRHPSLSHTHTPYHHQRLLTDSRTCAQNHTSAHRSPPHACRSRRSHRDTHAHSPTRPARTPQCEDKAEPGLSTCESRSLGVLRLRPPHVLCG